MGSGHIAQDRRCAGGGVLTAFHRAGSEQGQGRDGGAGSGFPDLQSPQSGLASPVPAEVRQRIARDINDNIGVQLMGALHSQGEGRKNLMIREGRTDLCRCRCGCRSLCVSAGFHFPVGFMPRVRSRQGRGRHVGWHHGLTHREAHISPDHCSLQTAGMADTPCSGGVRSPGEVGQPLPVRAFRFSILAKASSVRVNRWRSPARRQRSSTVRLRPEAFCAVQAAYNFARRLGTLNGLTPYEYICKTWASKPDRFISNPIHQMPGLNTW